MLVIIQTYYLFIFFCVAKPQNGALTQSQNHSASAASVSVCFYVTVAPLLHAAAAASCVLLLFFLPLCVEVQRSGRSGRRAAANSYPKPPPRV